MPKIQMRRDTAANWKSVNPILAAGEWGVETDTTKTKVGDGVTHYNDLDYIREEDNEWEKPSEWIDIRSGALPNSVYFLVGTGQRWGNMQDLYTFDQQGNLTGCSDKVYYRQISGDHYIDTLLRYDVDTDELGVIFTKDSSLGGPANQGPFLGSCTNNTQINMQRYVSNFNGRQVAGYGTADVKHTIEYVGSSFYIDGVLQGVGTESTTTSSATIRVGKSPNGAVYGNIYRYWHKRNGEYLINLLPVPAGLKIGSFICPTNGFFDTVSQQFYQNEATGTPVSTFGIDDEPGATDYQTFSVHPTISNSGTYDVYVDGIKQATTASNEITTLDWGTLNLVSGWDVTYPTALKTHIVRVTPSISSNSISGLFNSTTVNSGLLWAHFTITNKFTLQETFVDKYLLLEAITCSGDALLLNSLYHVFGHAISLKYVCPLDFDNRAHSTANSSFSGCTSLKTVTFKNFYGSESRTANSSLFSGCINLKNVIFKNSFVQPDGAFLYNCPNLKSIPPLCDFRDTATYYSQSSLLRGCASLCNTNLDLSFLNKSNQMYFLNDAWENTPAIKNIVVSNSAPFDSLYSPQLEVNYTGLDTHAIRRLFKSMPYNVSYQKVGNPTIVDGVVSGFSGSDYLQIPYNLGFGLNDFEVVIKYTCSEINVLNYIMWFGYYNDTEQVCINLMGDGTIRLIMKQLSTEDTILRNTGFELNKPMWVRLKRTGTSVNFSTSQDGVNYISGHTWSNFTGNLDFSGVPFLGNTGITSQTDRYLRGSIDLNESYIKVNGVPWFGPGVTKNLVPGGTLVGSPTVTDGVMSGFASNKGLTIPEIDITNTNWEIVVRANRGTGSAGNALLCYGNGQPMYIYMSTSTLTFHAGGVGNISISGLSASTYYWVRVRKEGNTCYLDYSTDGKTYTGEVSEEVDFSSYGTATIHFGQAPYYYSNYFGGSVDLNNSYINVNGSRFWTGMVPQVKTVSVVGCPGTTGWNETVGADVRAIALNKGWEVSY